MSEIVAVTKRLTELKKNQLALDILDEFANIANRTEQYFELANAYSEVCADAVAIKFAEKALASSNNTKLSYDIRTFLIRLYLNIKEFKKADIYIYSLPMLEHPLDKKADIYISVNKKIGPTAELQYLSMLAKEQEEKPNE